MKRHIQRRLWQLIAVAVFCSTFLIGGCGKRESEEVEGHDAVPVEVLAPTNMVFREDLVLHGTLESKDFALVPAKVAGTVEKIFVQEGDAVEKGETLCDLDSEILRRSAESRRKDLAVAKKSLAVARAKEEQAQATNKLAQKDYERFKRLAREEAVAQHQLDKAERDAVTAKAALQVAKEQVALSKAQVEKAESALAIAERKLVDASVKAPIAGLVSHKFRELGEMVDTGKPVFRIDNPNNLEVSVFAPGDEYSRIVPGETRIRLEVQGRPTGEFTVSYRSPTVDDDLRTFEVKALISSPSQGVVAGQIATARIILKERQGYGVSASAVLERDGEDVIFLATEGKARMQRVDTGLFTDGHVEIRTELPQDAKVIVRGQDLVNDGDKVQTVGGK